MKIVSINDGCVLNVARITSFDENLNKKQTVIIST
jgi:hypothetical protein